jgi:hypothetical protein
VYDLVVDANQRDFRKATTAVTNPILPLPGLSPVGTKKFIAQFDGGLLSSDAGVLVLRDASNVFASPNGWPPVVFAIPL